MNSTYVQLKKNLEYLKLNQMDLHLDEVIDLITSSPLSFTEGLCKLTNYEIDFKEANMNPVHGKSRSFSSSKRDQ